MRERIERLLDEGTLPRDGRAGRARDLRRTASSWTSCRPTWSSGRGGSTGRRAVVQGDDFTVRGGAADAAIWQKMVYAERLAHDLRVPLVRLVDGTGGGGSRQDARADGLLLRAAAAGLRAGGREPLPRAGGGRRARARRRAGRGAGRRLALLGDRARHRSALRRRAAGGGGGHGRGARQGAARRRPGADPRRRGGQRGRRRGRRAGPAAPLPLLPPRQRLGGAARRGRHRSARPPRGGAALDRPARAPASPTRCAASWSWCSTAARCSRWARASAAR